MIYLWLGWSAPSGVSMLSIGVGQQLGGQLIDSIIVMNYRAAVKAFYDGKGQLQLGMAVSVAAGPYGRSADVAASASSTSHIAATYTYSASKGFYIGYSLEGARISDRPNTNMAYYRQPITAKEILTGHVQPPQDAVQLYDILNSLGAGPRPGLPFAPKKSQNSLSTHFIPTAPNQQELEASAPPPQLTHSNSDLPPPPYAAYDQQLDSGSSQESIHNSNITISRKDETQPRDIKQLYNWYQPSRDMLKVVIATYDFTANEPTELSFKAGDMIIVLNRFESRESWWEGQIGGRRGYFPANYTKDLTD